MRTKICTSPWCKGTFTILDSEISFSESGEEILPNKCRLCRESESQVTWEDKKYEGSRWDGVPHQFKYKISKYF